MLTLASVAPLGLAPCCRVELGLFHVCSFLGPGYGAVAAWGDPMVMAEVREGRQTHTVAL